MAGPDVKQDMEEAVLAIYSFLKGTWNGNMPGFTFHGVPEIDVNRDGCFGKFGIEVGGRRYDLTLAQEKTAEIPEEKLTKKK